MKSDKMHMRADSSNKHIWLCLVGLFACGLASAACGPAAPQKPLPAATYVSQKGWILAPAKAKEAIAGGALVLDVRHEVYFRQGHIAGSQHTRWEDFANPTPPQVGNLLADQAVLNQRLQALGVSASKGVVVIGDTKEGFGDTGRLVWTLRTLGHPDAAFVDGGMQALLDIGLTLTQETAPPTKGDFVVSRTTQWEVSREALVALVAQSTRKIQLIDARTLEEYNGATIYGEARGGHLPGAHHLHYQDLLNEHGQLKSREALLAMLKAPGITPETPVIAYCTAGIRAGFLTTVLVDLGFSYVNLYAGSMLEWSNMPADTHPLVK